MVSKRRFHRNTDTEINIKELYNYYNEICPNFYFYLQKKLKKNLVYRSSHSNYWNEKELLKKKCKLSKIDFKDIIQNYLVKQKNLKLLYALIYQLHFRINERKCSSYIIYSIFR